MKKKTKQKAIDYYDLILEQEEGITTAEMAKDYGMTEQEFLLQLAKIRMVEPKGDVWIPNVPLVSRNFFHLYDGTLPYKGKRINKLIIEWTQEGRLVIYWELEKEGIFPLIDKKNRRKHYRYEEVVKIYNQHTRHRLSLIHFLRKLTEKGYLERVEKGFGLPKQEHIIKGLFKLESTSKTLPDGVVKTSTIPYITLDGLDLLIKHFV